MTITRPPWLLIGLLATAAIWHLSVLVDHVQTVPVLGLLFIAYTFTCLGLAAALTLIPTRMYLLAAVALNVAAVATWLLTRATTVPALSHHVGVWTDPYAVAALALEAATVACALGAVRRDA